MDDPVMIPTTPGQLNYRITKECIKYITILGATYKTFNEIIGVLECAKLEFYRRQLAAYEDQKRNQNGDVYA